MEHISRLTTRDVDVLLAVSDTSRRGLQAAFRINQLARDLNIGVEKSYLIINQVKEQPSDTVLQMVEKEGIELAGTIPEDDVLYEFDLNGRPTIEMPEDNGAIQAAFEIFSRIIP
jgi:CO dehydrogenase maturation factor